MSHAEIIWNSDPPPLNIILSAIWAHPHFTPPNPLNLTPIPNPLNHTPNLILPHPLTLTRTIYQQLTLYPSTLLTLIFYRQLLVFSAAPFLVYSVLSSSIFNTGIRFNDWLIIKRCEKFGYLCGKQYLWKKNGMETKDIYSLELHESLNISPDLCVTRVPGGWLYRFWNYKTDCGQRATFMPFSLNKHP